MHIVEPNDDGVTAPGLLALTTEMRKLGKVSILAPDRNWSASGHVHTITTWVSLIIQHQPALPSK